MPWYLKLMPQKPKIVEEFVKSKTRENEEKISHSPKEKLIVFFLWLMLTMCALSFTAYIVMLSNGNEKAKDMLEVFYKLLAALTGYFLGINKEGK